MDEHEGTGAVEPAPEIEGAGAEPPADLELEGGAAEEAALQGELVDPGAAEALEPPADLPEAIEGSPGPEPLPIEDGFQPELGAEEGGQLDMAVGGQQQEFDPSAQAAVDYSAPQDPSAAPGYDQPAYDQGAYDANAYDQGAYSAGAGEAQQPVYGQQDQDGAQGHMEAQGSMGYDMAQAAQGADMYGHQDPNTAAYGHDPNAGAAGSGYAEYEQAPAYGDQAGAEQQGGMDYGRDAGQQGYAVGGDPAAGAGDLQASARALAEQLVAEEREKHESAMKLEARAREELEDMILRIEKHFKAEQAARKKAEELLQASIAAEMDAKAKMEDVLKKRASEQRVLEDERAAIKRERSALEMMRQEFEAELQAARAEVAKAQEALAGSEERIRAAEQLERARLEGEYQAKLLSMQNDMERMREEMGYRMMLMAEEMEKWRQQAALTANAVMEAKNEVVERKKEMDGTREKMDRLLDKLYIGRERGVELSGAIASNQRMMSFLPGHMQAGPGHMQAAMYSVGPGVQGYNAPNARSFLSPIAGQPVPGRAGKLPPLQSSPPYPGMGMDPFSMLQQPGQPGGQVKHMASGSQSDGGGHYAGGYAGSPGALTSRSDGPGGYGMEGAGPAAGAAGYSHVQSKFAQEAAEAGQAGKARAGKAGANRSKAKPKPDRFAEAEREQARLGAMGKRWN